MIKLLVSFVYVAVVSWCCVVSGQQQSTKEVRRMAESSQEKLLLSKTEEAEVDTRTSSRRTQTLATTPDVSKKPAIGTRADSMVRSVGTATIAPAVVELAITREFSAATPPPATDHSYSFQRDGIPTIQQRRQLRAIPIELRPYRPFHFYGNAVRRRLGR